MVGGLLVEVSWGLLGVSGGVLGASWGPLGGLLGPLGGLHLRIVITCTEDWPQWAWGPLGGLLGGRLEASWRPLGGLLEASWRPRGTYPKPKPQTENPKCGCTPAEKPRFFSRGGLQAPTWKPSTSGSNPPRILIDFY